MFYEAVIIVSKFFFIQSQNSKSIPIGISQGGFVLGQGSFLKEAMVKQYFLTIRGRLISFWSEFFLEVGQIVCFPVVL